MSGDPWECCRKRAIPWQPKIVSVGISGLRGGTCASLRWTSGFSWGQKTLEGRDRRDYLPSMSTVTVQIPREALALAGLDDQSDSERARLLVALELFREERVSLGRAAELAGLGLEEFMDFSAHRQVPLHYAADDLAKDRNTADRLKL